MEMTDLSGMGNVKKFTKGFIPSFSYLNVILLGNQEKVAKDLTSTTTPWDQELAESGGYFLDRTPEGFNKEVGSSPFFCATLLGGSSSSRESMEDSGSDQRWWDVARRQATISPKFRGPRKVRERGRR